VGGQHQLFEVLSWSWNRGLHLRPVEACHSGQILVLEALQHLSAVLKDIFPFVAIKVQALRRVVHISKAVKPALSSFLGNLRIQFLWYTTKIR